MTDIIEEIRLLERACQKRLDTVKTEQERLLMNAKKYSVQDTAQGIIKSTQEREQALRVKEKALEATKQQFIMEAEAEADRLRRNTQDNRADAIEYILDELTSEDA